MRSKLEATRPVTQAGGSVIIASGRNPEPLTRILKAETVGTLFLAKGRRERARGARWIGLDGPPRGHLVVDPGVRQGPLQGGKSLLAIGVVDVQGDFDVWGRGRDPRWRGPNSPGAVEPHATAEGPVNPRPPHRPDPPGGQGSSTPCDEVVHRDNLVLTS
ncbi:MAG: hypothetical protein U0800_10360 [Isosphaeraceae bacterium]